MPAEGITGHLSTLEGNINLLEVDVTRFDGCSTMETVDIL